MPSPLAKFEDQRGQLAMAFSLKQNIRPSSVHERASKTTEEIDCEKRGYILTKTVLGSGAYAKVKLAYVNEIKREKDRRLARDLDEKGHNKVRFRFEDTANCCDPFFQKKDIKKIPLSLVMVVAAEGNKCRQYLG